MYTTFNNNRKALLFLPLLYIAWEDNILTKKEFKSLTDFIQNQDWLTDNDKELLQSKLIYDASPPRHELQVWKEIIYKALQHIKKPKSLLEIGSYIANEDTEAYTKSDINTISPAFDILTDTLGVNQAEIIYNLKQNEDNYSSSHKTEESFDVQSITNILDGDQAGIINKVKEVISRPGFKIETITDVHKYREKVLEWCHVLAGEGLGAYAYPKEQGGRDDIEGYFSIMETLSYHDLSLVIKFGVQFGLWGMSILSLGTEKHFKKYLQDVGTLHLPGCFAMTETHHGSNVKGLRTTATYNHANRTFTINTPGEYDRKEYIGNAANHGEMATVFAKMIIDGKDHGVSAFIVPIRDKDKNVPKGIEISDCGHKMGLNGVDNGIISFNNVVIPYDNLLDKFAGVNANGEFETPIPSDNRRFFTMLGTLVGGRIGIPRSAMAAAKTGLTIAIKYGDKRRQFGPDDKNEVPVLNYRMHQQRLMPYLANAYALHFGLQYLTQRFVNRKEEELQEIEAMAAGMKAYVTWNTRDTLQECREACGGKGYISENRIGDLKNDIEIYTTFEGDNTVLMQLTAKNRLGEYRKQFGEMSAATIFNYVVDKAKTSITEKNPMATRNTDENHLKDTDFLMQAFTYREKEILASGARRFKKLIDEGLEAFDAANIMHPHMLNIAEAYLDRVFLEQFIAKLDSLNASAEKDVLARLCHLFALNKIQQHKGWYLEQGYMEGVKTKAIRKLISQLCWEIRKDAVPLADAFAIPDNCLAAVITDKIAEA